VPEERSSSLLTKILAVLVLAVAGWFLLKFAIGLIAGVATAIVAVVAILAIVWAIRAL
jgi:hypothetical protein